MKFLFSIFFLIVFQFTYAQIGVINTNHRANTGKIEKCIITKNDKEKCEWVARLSYKDLSLGRYYTLKYKVQGETLNAKPTAIVRKIKFSKSRMELDYVYRQIERWKSNTDADKPEKIKITLGDNILNVSERRNGNKHELYFAFDTKEEKGDENISTNGLLFNAEDLGQLFGIKE